MLVCVISTYIVHVQYASLLLLLTPNCLLFLLSPCLSVQRIHHWYCKPLSQFYRPILLTWTHNHSWMLKLLSECYILQERLLLTRYSTTLRFSHTYIRLGRGHVRYWLANNTTCSFDSYWSVICVTWCRLINIHIPDKPFFFSPNHQFHLFCYHLLSSSLTLSLSHTLSSHSITSLI